MRPLSRSTRLLVALCLNVGLVVAEILAGLFAHASVLWADAGHNLTDVVAVVAALLALRWATRPRSKARTFGNYRATILVALFNAIVLVLTTAVIVAVSIERLMHPEPVNGRALAVVAAVAIVVNALAALSLRRHEGDLNVRAVLVDMLADCFSAAVALGAGLIVMFIGNGADRADPAASLAVSLLIIGQAFRLVQASVGVLLESTPADIDLDAIRSTITAIEGVSDVHDIHVWSLSSDVRALSAHLVLDGHPTLEEAQAVGEHVRTVIGPRFALAHSTLALECERCADLEDPCDIDELAQRALTRDDSHST